MKVKESIRNLTLGKFPRIIRVEQKNPRHKSFKLFQNEIKRKGVVKWQIW